MEEDRDEIMEEPDKEDGRETGSGTVDKASNGGTARCGRRREAPAADRTSKQDHLKNKAMGDKVIADAWTEEAAVADEKTIKEEEEPAVVVDVDEKDDAIKVARRPSLSKEAILTRWRSRARVLSRGGSPSPRGRSLSRRVSVTTLALQAQD